MEQPPLEPLRNDWPRNEPLLRIASFNLENLDAGPGAAVPVEDRLRVLQPQLIRLAADILCLQEVNGQHPGPRQPRGLQALDRLLAETPYAGFHRAVAPPPHAHGPIGDKHNLVVLSRWPIEAQFLLRHHRIAPPAPATAGDGDGPLSPVMWDRPVQQLRIGLPDGPPLHLLHLHLRAPLAAPIPGQKLDAARWRTVAGWAEGFHRAALKRIGQALETRLAVDALLDADPDALILVAGDCNAEERETPLRLLRADVADTGNPLLAGRSLVPLETHLPPARRYSVLHGGQPVLLDHLLASRALAVWFRDCAIHNEGLTDELADLDACPPSPESHHAPVVAVFAWPHPPLPPSRPAPTKPGAPEPHGLSGDATP